MTNIYLHSRHSSKDLLRSHTRLAETGIILLALRHTLLHRAEVNQQPITENTYGRQSY